MLDGRCLTVERASSIWETEPVGPPQPRYYNAVVAGETSLGPFELLACTQEIERVLGRRRGEPWGPRPIDIDILFYGDERIDAGSLTVPHPRIVERAFVLAPLAEVERGPLPVINATAIDLLANTGTAGTRRTGEPLTTAH
ncbi:MAG: 2-amino-4-hydroxy-6-hydroxymethyldihydropteridine diphosphokinase [Dehalococcoidia bacterium]